MLTAIIDHKKDTLIVELPCGNLDLQMKLMSIGVRQPPNQIHLFGTEDEGVRVQLASDDESVKYLPALFRKNVPAQVRTFFEMRSGSEPNKPKGKPDRASVDPRTGTAGKTSADEEKPQNGAF